MLPNSASGAGSSNAAEEFKRRRGQMACAECRRLKLKCDRKAPCASCVKRGCAAICPTGTLAAGPGNRFVLANTTHLHEKIGSMSSRISELEDALAALQSQFSAEPHPLLSDAHLEVKIPLENPDKGDSLDESDGPLLRQMGTLVVGERAHFFGPNAAPDFLLLADREPVNSTTSNATLPVDLILLSNTFPLSMSTSSAATTSSALRDAQDAVRLRLGEYLPSLPEAWKLVDLYYKDAVWIFNPLPQEQFMASMFAPLYGDAGAKPVVMAVEPHALALVFMVFAMACMVDMTLEPLSPDASNYYQLARAALSLDSVLEHPTMEAVCAMHLMSSCLQMGHQIVGPGSCYALTGLRSQLCSSLGLHRQDKHWALTDVEKQARRHLFWEAVAADCWTSYAFGRPSSWSLPQIDALLPDLKVNVESEPGQSFRRWHHSFTRDCLLKFMDEAFGVGPVAYGTVMRLDRLVREHPIVDELRLDLAVARKQGKTDAGKTDQWGVPPEVQPQSDVPQMLVLQQNAVFVLTQKLLLHIHRAFFADAMLEHPVDPLKSKYAQSVLATFRAAVFLSASIRGLFVTVPLAQRYWMHTSNWFSACIILSSVVVRSPGSGLAPAAWVELDRACEVMSTLPTKNAIIERILPKMQFIRQRAQEAYTQYTLANGAPPISMSCKAADVADLRYLFGGSRLVKSGSIVGEQLACYYDSALLRSMQVSEGGKIPFTVSFEPGQTDVSLAATAATNSSGSTGSPSSGAAGSADSSPPTQLLHHIPDGDPLAWWISSMSPPLVPPTATSNSNVPQPPQPLQSATPVHPAPPQPTQQRSAWSYNSYDVIPAPPPVPVNGNLPPHMYIDVQQPQHSASTAQPTQLQNSADISAMFSGQQQPLQSEVVPDLGQLLSQAPLPVPSLDETWQRFMQGIGMADVDAMDFGPTDPALAALFDHTGSSTGLPSFTQPESSVFQTQGHGYGS